MGFGRYVGARAKSKPKRVKRVNEIKVGDRVVFTAGRARRGRVANIAEGMATIATDAGKNVNRKLSRLTPKTVEPAPDAASAPVADNG